MLAYLKIIRPSVCILSILVLLAGAIVAGNLFNTMLIPAAAVVFIITGSGNVINDFYDSKIDKINAPYRPIPSGKIKKEKALKYYFALSVVGLIISIFAGTYFFTLALANLVIAFFYARNFKKTPLLGNVFVSWLAASIFLGAAFVGYNINLTIITLFFISFIGTMAREIIKDIEDMKGDEKEGGKTFPILVGKERARITSAIFMLIAILSLSIPVLFNLMSVYYTPFAVLGALVAFYSMLIESKKSQKLVKIAMYLIAIGFIAGSVL